MTNTYTPVVYCETHSTYSTDQCAYMCDLSSHTVSTGTRGVHFTPAGTAGTVSVEVCDTHDRPLLVTVPGEGVGPVTIVAPDADGMMTLWEYSHPASLTPHAVAVQDYTDPTLWRLATMGLPVVVCA